MLEAAGRVSASIDDRLPVAANGRPSVGSVAGPDSGALTSCHVAVGTGVGKWCDTVPSAFRFGRAFVWLTLGTHTTSARFITAGIYAYTVCNLSGGRRRPGGAQKWDVPLCETDQIGLRGVDTLDVLIEFHAGSGGGGRRVVETWGWTRAATPIDGWRGHPGQLVPVRGELRSCQTGRAGDDTAPCGPEPDCRGRPTAHTVGGGRDDGAHDSRRHGAANDAADRQRAR